MPTWPRLTRVTSSLKPSRPWATLPVRPRSASMIWTSSGFQPHSQARCCRAYWSRLLSWLFRT